MPPNLLLSSKKAHTKKYSVKPIEILSRSIKILSKMMFTDPPQSKPRLCGSEAAAGAPQRAGRELRGGGNGFAIFMLLPTAIYVNK